MQPTLDQVLTWTRQAAQIAAEMQKDGLEKRYKDGDELVTAADTAVENFLLEKISSHFPDHSVNAEESGDHDLHSEHKWYIDPIDGTINYAHGIPMYATSVAYAYKGELEIGVLCCPGMHEDYWAIRGQGAWRNGERIRVSEVATLKESVLSTGFRSYLIDTPRSNVENFTRFTRKAQTVRRLGSAAFNMAYVACGRMEGFWEMELNPWDVAAGILLIREAGGLVEGLYGEADLLTDKLDILAANPTIFPQMRKTLLEQRDR